MEMTVEVEVYAVQEAEMVVLTKKGKCMVWYCTVWYGMVLYGKVLYGKVW